jgi:hypothetical protein
MYLAAPLPLLFLFLAYLNACAARLMLPGIFVFLCDLLIFLRTVARSVLASRLPFPASATFCEEERNAQE